MDCVTGLTCRLRNADRRESTLCSSVGLEVGHTEQTRLDLGEEVCAFVVVDDREQTADDLRDRLRGTVASFAAPTVWHIQCDPLPTNHTGKVDKPALARLAARS